MGSVRSSVLSRGWSAAHEMVYVLISLDNTRYSSQGRVCGVYSSEVAGVYALFSNILRDELRVSGNGFSRCNWEVSQNSDGTYHARFRSICERHKYNSFVLSRHDIDSEDDTEPDGYYSVLHRRHHVIDTKLDEKVFRAIWQTDLEKDLFCCS